MRDGECDGLSGLFLGAQKRVTLHGFIVVVPRDESEDFGMRGIVGAEGNPIDGHFLEKSSSLHFGHSNSARRHQNLPAKLMNRAIEKLSNSSKLVVSKRFIFVPKRDLLDNSVIYKVE